MTVCYINTYIWYIYIYTHYTLYWYMWHAYMTYARLLRLIRSISFMVVAIFFNSTQGYHEIVKNQEIHQIPKSRFLGYPVFLAGSTFSWVLEAYTYIIHILMLLYPTIIYYRFSLCIKYHSKMYIYMVTPTTKPIVIHNSLQPQSW